MITENIPLPRLLPSSTYAERRVVPNIVSITQKITPLSFASIQLPPGEKIPARGYMELFTCMGSAGIFRIRSPQESYGDDNATAELEHAVVEVGDYLVKAKYDEMMAASTAMQTVFSHYTSGGGTRWQLGSVSALGSGQIALQVNYDKVLTAMLAILDQKPDCMMAFDFSTSPWTISIVARGSTVRAEGRLSRNVNDASISYDDTELCTRVWYEKETTTDTVTVEDGFPVFNAGTYYVPGEYVSYNSKLYSLPNGHELNVTWANTTKTPITNYPSSEWSYVEDATAISSYGLIERSVSTGSNYTASEALYAATRYLNAHKSPRVSIKVSAEELSSETGETLDAFTIGKLCRLALVDYGVTVEKNITELTFNDVYGNPRDITVCLADEEDMVVNFLHDLDSKGGSGGGGGGKKKQDDKFKEYYTEFYRDDFKIHMAAYQADKVRGILKAAGIDIDANGVAIYASDKDSNLQSKINVQAGRIDLVVTGSGSSAYINIQAITDAINRSSVTISADRINLDGYVTTSMLEAAFQSVDQIACDQLSVTSYMTLDAYSVSWQSQSVITSVGVTKITKNFKLSDDSTWNHSVVTDVGKNSTTIYYLGR